MQCLISENKYKYILAAADFNINILEASPDSFNFYEIVECSGFRIHFLEPTRETSKTQTCIDNILTSQNYEPVHKLIFWVSDHQTLLINLLNSINKDQEILGLILKRILSRELSLFVQRSRNWNVAFLLHENDFGFDIDQEVNINYNCFLKNSF